MPKTLLTNQNVQISSPNPDIDWSRGDTFYLDTAQSETLTFSNVKNGQSIIIIVNNTSVSARTINFPAGYFTDLGFQGTVAAGLESVFTLIASNDKIYISEVKDLSDA